jgi:hypothetical protein
VSLRGLVWRYLRLAFGARAGRVPVQQCKCSAHNWFRAIPPFVLPRKHYAAVVVESALESPTKGVSVGAFCKEWGLPEPSTPRRWIAQFGVRLTRAGLECEGRLMGLQPDWRQPLHVCRDDRWMYAYVWDLLRQLRDACLASGLSPPSLPRLALFGN